MWQERTHVSEPNQASGKLPRFESRVDSGISNDRQPMRGERRMHDGHPMRCGQRTDGISMDEWEPSWWHAGATNRCPKDHSCKNVAHFREVDVPSHRTDQGKWTTH